MSFNIGGYSDETSSSQSLSNYMTSATAQSTFVNETGDTMQGDLALNDNALLLRTSGDTNHEIQYNFGIDGIQSTGFGFHQQLMVEIILHVK